jgi:hypothetical protein
MTPQETHDEENFEQRWFPGVHSDVGGGVPDTGLSDVTLEWMAEKATRHGLRMDLRHVLTREVRPEILQDPYPQKKIFYRLASQLLVKLPGAIGIVRPRYRESIKNLKWNGDYMRPIEDKGPVDDFIGIPPKNPDIGLYRGSLHSRTIEKINVPDCVYLPDNVLDRKKKELNLPGMK